MFNLSYLFSTSLLFQSLCKKAAAVPFGTAAVFYAQFQYTPKQQDDYRKKRAGGVRRGGRSVLGAVIIVTALRRSVSFCC